MPLRRASRSGAPPDGGPALRPADVDLLYRELLGRPASPADIDAQLRGCRDVGELVRVIMGSDERRSVEALRRASTAHHANVWTPELAAFTPPPGTLSPDGVAEVGREGTLFLVGGTNDLRTQLDGRAELPPGWADGWCAAVERRQASVARIGAQGVWLVTPDKAIVAGELLTVPPAGDGRPFLRLRERLGLELLYPERELRTCGGPAYLPTDTHLTLAGNRALAAVCLDAVGGPPPQPLDALETATILASGDLGSRFDPALLDVRQVATAWPVRIVRDNREEIAALGGHVGTVRVLECPDAPDPRTCVVFGDSYSFGDDAYQGLIWWLAQAFRAVHFIWQPFGWDPDYAARIGADVVVFSGAERFCLRVPPEPVAVEALIESSLRRLRGEGA